MPFLAALGTADISISPASCLAVQSSGWFTIESPIGTPFTQGSGSRTYDNVPGPTARITATSQQCYYEVNGDAPVTSLTAAQVGAVQVVLTPTSQSARAAAARNLQTNGASGDLGALAGSWTGTRSDAGANATRQQYTRAIASAPSSLSPDKTAPNVIRIIGNDGASQVTWTEPITGIDATTVRSVGIWCRASQRPDGRFYSQARFILAQDSAGSPNFGVPFADWRFSVPADNVWRFVVLSTSATVGINTGGSAVFLPGTGITLAHARVASVATIDIGSRSAAIPTGAYIEYGAIRINPRGLKAAGIFRIDDGYSSIDTPFGSLWDTALPSGFTAAMSASGRTITLAQGRLLSMLDLADYFGFKASLFVLGRQAGLRGYLTVPQLQAIQARGHLIALQSFANPTDNVNSGVRLLGSYGFNIAPATTITAVAGAVLTWPSHPVTATTTNATAPQGFPVVFDFAGPPAGINRLTSVYWLRNLSASTVSVHPSETDAADNINAISFAGITAANIVIRFAGASSDETNVTADIVNMVNWANANGFVVGAKTFAPNQSNITEALEAGMRTVGVSDVFCGGFSPASDVYFPPFAAGAFTYINAGAFTAGADYCLSRSDITTDGGSNEAAIRAHVRSHVQEGSVIQNVQHAAVSSNIAHAVWYLDEMRYWVDQGLLYVDTADKVAAAIRAVRIGG